MSLRSLGVGFLTLGIMTGCVDPFARPLTDEGPVIGEGRIERPAAGYALELPPRWEAREISDEEHPGFGRWGRPIGSLGGRLDIFAAAPAGNGGCYVHVNGSLAHEDVSLDEYAARTVRDLRSDAGNMIKRVRQTDIDLVAGHSRRLDIGSASEYIFVHEGVFYALGCFRADGESELKEWRSIARTFEFLPSEEPASAEAQVETMR
jgi:hypothetical protein